MQPPVKKSRISKHRQLHWSENRFSLSAAVTRNICVQYISNRLRTDHFVIVLRNTGTFGHWRNIFISDKASVIDIFLPPPPPPPPTLQRDNNRKKHCLT